MSWVRTHSHSLIIILAVTPLVGRKEGSTDKEHIRRLLLTDYTQTIAPESVPVLYHILLYTICYDLSDPSCQVALVSIPRTTTTTTTTMKKNAESVYGQLRNKLKSHRRRDLPACVALSWGLRGGGGGGGGGEGGS